MSLIRYVRGFLNLNQMKSIQHRTISYTKCLLDTDLADRVVTPGEQKLIEMLKERFSKSKLIEVVDISGGCGSMYAVYVETKEFKGLRTVKQHQLVTEVLRKEIKDNMHGVRIQTAVAED